MAIKKLKHITVICEELYSEIGNTAVYDYCNIYMAKHPDGNVQYKPCKGCEAETPHWYDDCLVCGEPIVVSKETLVNAVIADLKKGFEAGDYTVLDELLNMIPNENLVQALPEEQWKQYKSLLLYIPPKP